jgi:glutamate-1-semialdehyde 2,1-aminomutase
MGYQSTQTYPALSREIDTYKRRTPKSAAAHEKAMGRLPIGVGSNYRYYPPYPLFARDGEGGRVRDIDGNEYIDHNLAFGALMAGHCHPAVMRAVEKRLRLGTLFGMPHGEEFELAEEICARFPVEMVRFGNSGTEVTMHSLRLARAVTGREKVIKMEGCYHGGHDAVSVSLKPSAEQFGNAERPTPVISSAGVLQATADATLVAPFNNLAAVERLFEEHPGAVAAVIVEPVMMNVGICMPEDGYLNRLCELTRKHGALFIMDEVKTGVKLARGGACEYFDVKPDIVCLGKSIGGGLPLAAFGASRIVMDVIATRKMFHGGTYNTNPTVMAAGLAMFREVLTDAAYAHVNLLSGKLLDGYASIIRKTGLVAYVEGAGANGALMFYPKRIRNYREWYGVDDAVWMHYWFGMVNRGVIPQPFWWDEQWTISVQHTEREMDAHLAAFAEMAPALAEAQQERIATLTA